MDDHASADVLGGGHARGPHSFRIEEDFRLIDFGIAHPLVYLAVDGNPQLSSERLIGYEAGYRTLVTPKIYIDIAVFHNDYNDLINLGAATVTLDPTPAPVHLTLHLPFANGLRGNTDGFEIAPDWKPSRWWQMKATYSYLNLHLDSIPGVVDSNGYIGQRRGVKSAQSSNSTVSIQFAQRI